MLIRKRLENFLRKSTGMDAYLPMPDEPAQLHPHDPFLDDRTRFDLISAQLVARESMDKKKLWEIEEPLISELLEKTKDNPGALVMRSARDLFDMGLRISGTYIEGLHPHLDENKVNDHGNHESFGFIRTLLMGRYNDETINSVQEEMHRKTQNTFVYLSKPGEIEGFRRFAYYGMCNDTIIVGVSDDGVPQAWSLPHEKIKKMDLEGIRCGILNYSSYFLKNCSHDKIINTIKGIGQDRSEEMKCIDKDYLIENHGVQPSYFNFNTRSRFNKDVCDEVLYIRKGPLEKLERQDRAKILSMSSRRYNKFFNIMTNSLIKEIDPEILRTGRSLLSYDTDSLRWLAGMPTIKDQHIDMDYDIGAVRRQAVKAYPLLFKTFMNDYYLTKTIDRREELVPALSRNLLLKANDIKKIQGLTWQKTCLSPVDPQFMKIIRIPQHVFPKTRGEFRKFGNLTCVGVGERGNFLSEKITQSGVDSIRIMKDTTSGMIHDAIRDISLRLATAICAPKIESQKYLMRSSTSLINKNKDIIAKHFENMSLSQLVEVSHRWHRNLPRIEEAISYKSNSQEDIPWKPLFGDVDLGSGFSFHENNSKGKLSLTGKLENNCTAGYVSRIVNKKSHGDGSWSFSIVGKMSRDEATIATMELSIDMKGKVSVIQNFGRSNTKPSADAVNAAKKLTQVLGNVPEKNLKDYESGLKDWRSENMSLSGGEAPIDKIQENNNINLRDPDIILKTWTAYEKMLPKSIKSLGIDGLKVMLDSEIEIKKKQMEMIDPFDIFTP